MAKRVFVPFGDVTSLIQVRRRMDVLSLDAVIFVVDSADIDRLNVAKAELSAILKVDVMVIDNE